MKTHHLITHGHTSGGRTKEYAAWTRLNQSCRNPDCKDYGRYGGRGIQVRYQSFEEFFADLGEAPSPKHSVDRIINSGHYEPGNCRWATPKEQANNRRSNKLITFDGRTMNIAQWANEIGIDRKTLEKRLGKYGWDVPKALTTPVK